MRVAYFDLGFSREDYSLNPRRYGGGAVAARYLKEDLDIEFHVIAPAEAFGNLGPTERKDRCFSLDPMYGLSLKQGFPLTVSASDKAFEGYDLILHPHTCATINRGTYRGPIVHFCGFDGTAGHPGNDYVLLYDPAFKPLFGERAKYVRIGKPVPATFAPASKEEFLFQCSRHDDTMNSISVARECLERGIRGVFAGPIHGDYRLLDYINGTTTVYLGEIDEVTKLDYCRRAKLFTLNHTWPALPFNQSCIEAQGQGTPIWVNPDCYFFRHYLQEGVNGYSTKTHDLAAAFAFAGNIKQENCWRAARAYDASVMVESFKKAFEEIVTEWRTKS